MKTLRLLLTAGLFALACAAAHAGAQFAFDAPVDCSAYVAGGGTATKFEIRSINYDTGELRFQLIDAQGAYLGGGAVFGLTLPAPVDQDAAKAAILAAILAAITAAG